MPDHPAPAALKDWFDAARYQSIARQLAAITPSFATAQFLESVLEGPVTNRALSLPPESRTRSVIVQGAHEYGKIALASALNYELPTLVPDAVPPNIGYLAQSF